MSPDEERAADALAATGSLRAYILGTWRLESYVDVAEDGSVASEPLGGRAEGLLIYAPDGFMSVQMMRSARRPFSSGDWFSPTPDELEEAARFIGYSGRYSVDEATQLVVHEVAISFFPNWTGHAQTRRTHRSGGGLVLTPDKPLHSGGRMVTPRLTWTRPPSRQACPVTRATPPTGPAACGPAPRCSGAGRAAR